MDDGYLSEGEGAPIDNDDFGAELEGTLISLNAASCSTLLHCFVVQCSTVKSSTAQYKMV